MNSTANFAQSLRDARGGTRILGDTSEGEQRRADKNVLAPFFTVAIPRNVSCAPSLFILPSSLPMSTCRLPLAAGRD